MHASPFDQLAIDYDRDFTLTACGLALRDVVWSRLPVVFGNRRCILELGCGTGEDAVHLARAGHQVVAIDVSEKMISIARLKAMAAGCADRIQFHVLPIEALHTLPRDLRFDGVFSNFGAINCVADVSCLARTLAQRLEPGAPLMFVVMGRHVPWEWAWFLAHGDRARAFRRLRIDGVAWRGIRIQYPTPAKLGANLSPWFEVTRRAALGFALPPSYAAAWLDRSPRMLAALGWLERAMRSFTAGLADHYMLEATQRKLPR
jgi:SAM-dependent methyltransferase